MADADGRRLNGGRGLGAALAADFDPWAAVGGVRGLVETTVPGIIFLVVYTVTKDVGLSVVAPLGVALGCLAVRLAQRIDVLPVLGGLLGIAASALWAWRTGRASDYFTLGLMTNAAYLAGLLLSLAVRWPALGLLIGFARGDATGWRSGGSDDRRATRRRYAVITWMWAGLFAARLAVQTPLYYTDATEALAVVRLIMGPPVYALLAWFTWLLVRGLPPVTDPVEQLEREALAVIVQFPVAAHRAGADELGADSFGQLIHRAVYEAVAAAGGTGEVPGLVQQAVAAGMGEQEAQRRATLRWLQQVRDGAIGLVEAAITELAVAPLPLPTIRGRGTEVDASGLDRYARGVLSSLTVMGINRRLVEMRSRHRRMSPQDEGYRDLFSQIAALEQRRMQIRQGA